MAQELLNKRVKIIKLKSTLCTPEYPAEEVTNLNKTVGPMWITTAPRGSPMSLSQGPHISYPACQTFTLLFLTAAK